jgi:hypothetical protein
MLHRGPVHGGSRKTKKSASGLEVDHKEWFADYDAVLTR